RLVVDRQPATTARVDVCEGPVREARSLSGGEARHVSTIARFPRRRESIGLLSPCRPLTAPLRRLRLIRPLANPSGRGGGRSGGLAEVREKTAPVLCPTPTSCMAHILDDVIIMAETLLDLAQDHIGAALALLRVSPRDAGRDRRRA